MSNPQDDLPETFSLWKPEQTWGVVLLPTNYLRFYVKDGKNILQQLWAKRGVHVWRDVPMVSSVVPPPVTEPTE